MGWESRSYSFSLYTDAHAGKKEIIDDALARDFLACVEVLAKSFNEGRTRDLVWLGWGKED